MDFTLNDEQQMLADAIGRFVEREYPVSERRALAATPRGFSDRHWQTLAEMGLLALNVPEDAGGLGAGPVETMLVMEALGRALVLEPFLPTAVLGATLLAAGASGDIRGEWLGGIAAGTLKLAVATGEPDSRFDLSYVETTARREGDQWRIDGRKAVVLGGDSADLLVIPARTSGAVDAPDGITLFAVTAGAPGLDVRGFPGMDGHRTAEVTLAGVVPAAVLGEVDRGYPLLEMATDRAIAALCAEAVGVMQRTLEMTADYLQGRAQFGKPLATFQAIQHRIADMFGAVEQARAVTLAATAAADSADRDARRRAVSTAKTLVGNNGRAIGEAAIQLHGGMGMTHEMDIGLYFKRLRCIDVTLGDADHHLALYTALMLPA